MMPYTVGADGNINFPIVGKINVQGLTRRECEDKIAGLVKPYLSNDINPVVVVEFQSYTITVLGEVARPGAFNVNSEKYSVLQALGRNASRPVWARTPFFLQGFRSEENELAKDRVPKGLSPKR